VIPPAPDAILVRDALSGDSAAFDLLLARHYPALLRVCLRLVGERTLAEDCAQDAAIVAWLRLSHLRSADAFRSWLNGIGRHVSQHALRTVASTPSIDATPDVADESPDFSAIDSDVRSAIREAIDDLPGGSRAAVRAFYLGGLDYAEAAAALDINLSALKMRLHSARHMLRHRFRLHDAPLRTERLTVRTRAIHEAAHAVLHCWYGGELNRVSIAPVSAVWIGPVPNSVARRLPVFLDLQVRMAGEVATALGHAGVSGGDRDAAATIALRETGGDQVEAALLLDHARREAQRSLEVNHIWRQVERVAAVLQDAQAVDGDDVRRLCVRSV
jgi:RNA polymerase sigma-70 factor (ECF subfamily)